MGHNLNEIPVFTSMDEDSSEIWYGPKGGSVPDKANEEYYPDQLAYSTGSRNNGSKYLLSVLSTGEYELRIEESPWMILQGGETRKRSVEGDIANLKCQDDDLYNELETIYQRNNQERLDDFIDNILRRALR